MRNSMTPEERKQKRKEYQRNYQRTWMKTRRQKWLEVNGPCRQCGSLERLEIDHIDPRDKVQHRVWSWSHDRMMAELRKCQVLCHECHKAKTAEYARQRQTGSRGIPKKLTEWQVREIRRQLSEGATQREIAMAHGITHAMVSRIKTGHYWSWLDREGGA